MAVSTQFQLLEMKCEYQRSHVCDHQRGNRYHMHPAGVTGAPPLVLFFVLHSCHCHKMIHKHSNDPGSCSAMLVLSHSTMVDEIYPLLSVRDILSVELVCRATSLAVKGLDPL